MDWFICIKRYLIRYRVRAKKSGVEGIVSSVLAFPTVELSALCLRRGCFFFGDKGPGSGGGLYGDLNYTADTCRQCKDPQCLKVCPIGAITWQQEEGCITVDHKRCIGCSACTTACPWMMATVNTETKKSSKCVLCGECANACPTGALKIIEWKDITV